MDYFVENSTENVKKVTDNLFFFLMCVAKMASSQITLHGKFCVSGMFPYFSEWHKVVFSLFCVLIMFLNDRYNPQNGQPFKNYYYYSHCLIWITFFQVFLFSNYFCQECFFLFPCNQSDQQRKLCRLISVHQPLSSDIKIFLFFMTRKFLYISTLEHHNFGLCWTCHWASLFVLDFQRIKSRGNNREACPSHL